MTWWTVRHRETLVPLVRRCRISRAPRRCQLSPVRPLAASPRRMRARGRRIQRRRSTARHLGLTNESTVLDLAAANGNLTRALREQFAHVFAVMPDARMRAQFEGDVLSGTAEVIPLPDNAVDAVFVGEAFHWFDAERALAEIRRVGGGLAILTRSWGETEQPGLMPAPVWAEFDQIGSAFTAGRLGRLSRLARRR